MNVTATIAARVLLNLAGVPVGDLTPSAYIDTTQELDITNGTTSFEADQVVSMAGTLTAGGTLGLDLTGAITDVFGVSVAMAKITGLVLFNTSAANSASGNVRIENATTLVDGLGSSSHFNLGPQGIYLIADPNTAGLITVTNATHDLLVIGNNHSAFTSTYALHIVGRSV